MAAPRYGRRSVIGVKENKLLRLAGRGLTCEDQSAVRIHLHKSKLLLITLSRGDNSPTILVLKPFCPTRRLCKSCPLAKRQIEIGFRFEREKIKFTESRRFLMKYRDILKSSRALVPYCLFEVGCEVSC